MAITKVSASLVDLDGGVVINESSADADFRVESNGNANMLFVDGGNDRVGINGTGTNARGGSNTVALFDVSGSGKNYVEIQGATDSTANGLLFSDGSSGNYGVLGYDHANDVMNFFTAGSERMRIDSSGRILIGTTSSSGSSVRLEAHDATNPIIQVKDTTSNIICGIQAGNAEAVIRCPQDSPLVFNVGASETERMRLNSSGQLGIACTDQSNLLTVDANSASSGTDSISVRNRGVSSANHTAGLRFQFNSAVPSAIRSRLTNTSNGEGTLSFFTSSDGTAGNLSEKMTIISGGDVCIGKTTNDINTQGFHVIGAGTYSGSVYSGITSAVSSSTYHLRDTTNNTWKFYVTNAGVINATSTSITSLSDERLKKNIVDLETGLEEVMSLKPRRFDWKKGEGSNAKNVAGFIAQEVETVLPDLIDDFMHDDLDDAKSVKMGDMIPTLVKAIQEQQEQIDELKAKLEDK
jgi:prepilin-type processing-associated H-X9-DG protein